jgi:uncharacterized protein (TIGR03435 family)
VLIAAYDLHPFQVTAPEWAPTTRYDIVAKVPAGTTKAQLRMMWQDLLRDRLKVAVHRESREFRVYEFTAAKGFPKMKETDLPATSDATDFAATPPKFGQNGTLDIKGTGSVITVRPTAVSPAEERRSVPGHVSPYQIGPRGLQQSLPSNPAWVWWLL